MYDVEIVLLGAVIGAGGLLVLGVLAAGVAVLLCVIVEVVQLGLFDLGGGLRRLLEDKRWMRLLRVLGLVAILEHATFFIPVLDEVSCVRLSPLVERGLAILASIAILFTSFNPGAVDAS